MLGASVAATCSRRFIVAADVRRRRKVSLTPAHNLHHLFLDRETVDSKPLRMSSFREKRNLPRLEKHKYQGHAVVFWTNTLEERGRGWLTPAFHARFREIVLHSMVREHLFCPAYCLMPDHLHLVWMGTRRESNQLNAIKFLRTQIEPALGGGRQWQHQPHDHVLREEERRRNAFASFCFYTLANPVRAGLSKIESDWPYSGALVPGYPTLHPFNEGYWELFWKRYVKAREDEPA